MYEQLIAVESIPPLPATAATLLAMAADPDVEIDALALVIERDPPLNARLLGIANSAFYAPRQPVMTAKDAIIRVLGLNMVRNMAFGMALTGGLSTAACPRFDLMRYWVMALGTADLASGLIRASRIEDLPDPDTAYLVGLLHNLGELLMVYLWPHEMDEALKRTLAKLDTPMEQHELDLLGMDHWQAGAFLARHWQLPSVVGDSIAALGPAADPSQQTPLVEVLVATRRWLFAVMAGRSDLLRIDGVDETYCDYRSGSFMERYDALKILARSMG